MSIRRCFYLLSLFVLSAVASVLLQVRGAANPADLSLAQFYYQQGEYQKALAILREYRETDIPAIHEYLGAAYQHTGRASLALSHWQRAGQLYQQRGEIQRAAEVILSQAQVYLELGRPQAAISLVNQSKIPLPPKTLGVLGNAYLVAGEYARAVESYEQLLAASISPLQELAALNNLTNAYQKLAARYRQRAELTRQEGEKAESGQWQQKARGAERSARNAASAAWQLGRDSLTPNGIRAQLAWLPFLEESERSPYLEAISTRLESLPPSHAQAQLWLSLAQVYPRPQAPLLQAWQVARDLGDEQVLSLAAGELGRFYERQGDYDQALTYTEQAQQAAYALLAYHSLYRWQWQEGRIYGALGKPEAAKSAYRRSVESLQRIRDQMAAAGRDVQFDFQAQVEPIYRGLLSLLLDNPSPDELPESLQIFDLLQLAQLENLFGDACFETASPDVSQWLSQQNAALFVPIILERQLHVILRLPDGTYRHQARGIDARELSRQIGQWRFQLRQVTETQYLNSSAFFYQLLFAAFSEAIEEAEPDSLIFIGDGLLRNVPMAALYDSESRQFLVEKYPVAVALGRNFLQPSVSKPLSSLTFGLGVARPPLEVPLPMVAREVKSVRTLLGGEQFLDAQFTVEQLRARLVAANPTVLHLATHGKFTGSVETSFIQAYDRRVGLNELERLLLDSGRSLELLTLSACETSAGNNRAVLGLAGVAVRAGVQSVLGTLWSVSDDVTLTVIADFYQNWRSGMSKAEALQAAQIKQIHHLAHPRSWSPFVLIGIN